MISRSPRPDVCALLHRKVHQPLVNAQALTGSVTLTLVYPYRLSLSFPLEFRRVSSHSLSGKCSNATPPLLDGRQKSTT